MPPTRVRPPLRRDAADDAGFTVIEVLVSFVLLAIVSTAGVAAIVNATAASGRSDNVAAASNLAQQNLQAARALRYPNYPAASGTPTPTVKVGTTTYTVLRTTTGSCPVPPTYDTNSSMLVTAKVTWPGSQTGVAMSTEIAC